MMDNESCVGCTFLIVNDTNISTDYDNPFSCGDMTNESNCTINWNVSADGPLKSEWEMFVNFDFNSTVGNQKQTNTIKTRIVDYKWDDITGYINSSWNCRKMVNVTPNVTDSGIVEIRDFEVSSESSSDNSCRIMNCTKEIRIAEVLANNSLERKRFVRIYNETNTTIVDGLNLQYNYCKSANIQFNTTLTANQTKSFFVYYNNPIIEIDYSSPTGTSLHNKTHNELNRSSNETVWDSFFDSHIDFWWINDYDTVSVEDRETANNTYHSLVQLNYRPQVYVNRPVGNFLETIKGDLIYYYDGHGDIVEFNEKNQSYFEVNSYNFPINNRRIFSDNITNLSNNLTAKFILISASFSGDNSTTKECLNHANSNWLSKAFTDKNAECFLGMQGDNVTVGESCSVDSDVHATFTTPFIKCFWNRVLLGDTIKQSTNYATNSSLCIDLDHEETIILVNSTINGCDKKLTG